MNNIKKAMMAAIVTLVAFQPAVAGAASLVLVINDSLAGMSSVSSQDLKQLYLGKATSIGGKDVKLVGLDDANKAQEIFLKEVLSMGADELKNYWIQESLKGGGSPPRLMNNPASMIIFVSKKEGAVGYLSADEAKSSGLKIVEVK